MGKSTAFKDTFTFEERCQESQDIIARYPDRLPLVEVAKDAKTTKDPTYAKILSSTLTSILVSLGVSAAKILVEDISNEYRRRRKNDTDVARSRTDTYIRSSLRTTFAQVRFFFVIIFLRVKCHFSP
ncbi:putative protein unc-13, Ubiquitin-like domain superfamily [Helianthus annuus]|nr:putative protein unc-13, Ubiquitin-like domain superfamily [Helianthus annuus]KAJ0607213.1 putative protein unc-13, Ubiquitin-like domain superfamily [Helianthus annuus]KAJ0767271.1 putative protein unc-13, Ubiquitin-like domain superfamily [Helianthus annuus]